MRRIWMYLLALTVNLKATAEAVNECADVADFDRRLAEQNLKLRRNKKCQ